MTLPRPIQRARAAQHLAARALARWGTAHPVARLALTAAALAAAAAWDAGHPVPALHPSPRVAQRTCHSAVPPVPGAAAQC